MLIGGRLLVLKSSDLESSRRIRSETDEQTGRRWVKHFDTLEGSAEATRLP